MALTTAQMGLKSWNQTSDLFDHDQLADNWAKIDLHDHTLNKGVQIPTAGIVDGAVTAAKMAAVDVISSAQIVNGSITNSKFVLTTQQQLGLTDGAQVGRGKSIIATTESRTNVAYGTLGTADRVTGVVLPPDGLIVIAYQATWQSSVANAGNAAIFIGANQLAVANLGVANTVLAAATTGSNANDDDPLATYWGGLTGGTGVGSSSDVTTGQVVAMNISAGGVCHVFAAPGTYDVSVQFKSTSGSVTAKNRKLWVWTIGF